VVRLWTWALDNAPEGNCTGFSDRVLAFGGGWTGDPSLFVSALQEAGWIDFDNDGRAVIHDWDDYAGRLIERRQANTERMRTARAQRTPSISSARAQNVQDTCVARAPATVPNRTVPNLTGPDQPETGASALAIAAAPPPRGPERAVPPPAVNSAPREVPRTKGVNLQPLVDAFRARGLKMPVITKRSAPQAGELLKHYAPDQIARCWQDVLTLEWGDDWQLQNLSFESLNSHNRMGNWVRDRDTPRPEPEERASAAPRPLPPPKPELPPAEQQRMNTWKLALERIQAEMRDQDFRSWFRGTRLVAAGPEGYVIEADAHQVGWLLKSRGKIARALGVDQELVEIRAQPVPVGASP
jgi:hypothetical protein